MSRFRSTLQGIARGLRAMLGVPDYDIYLAHVKARHPETSPVSREQFFTERSESRYNRLGSRCC